MIHPMVVHGALRRLVTAFSVLSLFHSISEIEKVY